ncbi:MAG: hypothetical protein U9Q22_05665 [Candidatus Altiarchaeota archaeon]|nr:hypothetical protein [Candidatus Altiarchaeota archaeon]
MSDKDMTKSPTGAPRYLKIIVTGGHNIERVNRIIDRFNPEFFTLESQSRLCNLKTLYIAQNLRRNGHRDMKMKFYKGELFKVFFSRTPRTSPQGVGDLMPDIDRSGRDEINEIVAPI